jgi:hypothetical protein
MKLLGIVALLSFSVAAASALPSEDSAADIVAVRVIDSTANAISRFNNLVLTWNYGNVPDTSDIKTLIDRGVTQIEWAPRLSSNDLNNVKIHVDLLANVVTDFLNSLDLERQGIMNLGNPTIKLWVDTIYRGIVGISVAIANKSPEGNGQYVTDNLFGKVSGDLERAVSKWSNPNRPPPTIPQRPDGAQVIISALQSVNQLLGDLDATIRSINTMTSGGNVEYGQALSPYEFSITRTLADAVNRVNSAGSVSRERAGEVQQAAASIARGIDTIINDLNKKRYAIMQGSLTRTVKNIFTNFQKGHRDLNYKIQDKSPAEIKDALTTIDINMWQITGEAEYTWQLC